MSVMEIKGAHLFAEDTGGASPAIIFTHALFFSWPMYAHQI